LLSKFNVLCCYAWVDTSNKRLDQVGSDDVALLDCETGASTVLGISQFFKGFADRQYSEKHGLGMLKIKVRGAVRKNHSVKAPSKETYQLKI
jgi:hypothetical protein